MSASTSGIATLLDLLKVADIALGSLRYRLIAHKVVLQRPINCSILALCFDYLDDR